MKGEPFLLKVVAIIQAQALADIRLKLLHIEVGLSFVRGELVWVEEPVLVHGEVEFDPCIRKKGGYVFLSAC